MNLTRTNPGLRQAFRARAVFEEWPEFVDVIDDLEEALAESAAKDAEIERLRSQLANASRAQRDAIRRTFDEQETLRAMLEADRG